MRDVLARVDDALIDRVFQPLVDWMDHHTEIGIFRAARFCVDLASLMWICAEANGFAGGSGFDGSGSIAFRFAIVVAGLWALSSLRGLFQRSDDARAANPLRAGMRTHRAACLFWMIALSIKTAHAPNGFEALALLAVGAFATSAVYIGACTTAPPKRRERRSARWAESQAL
jgi:hypothetical protein